MRCVLGDRRAFREYAVPITSRLTSSVELIPSWLEGAASNRSLRDARRLGQQSGSFRLVVVDLGLVEDAIAPREKATALGLVLAVVIRASGADLLPEDNRRGALALAHLGAECLPVAIGAPDAGGVTGALRCDPEREPIDTAIGFARRHVDWAHDRGVAAMPGHAVLAGFQLPTSRFGDRELRAQGDVGEP